MKTLISLTVMIFLITSCNQSPQDNIAYRIPEKDLIPEGICYSSLTNSFYISSIHKEKIIKVDAETGEHKDFTTPEAMKLSYLGMIVDEARNHLWACGNKDTSSAVVKFDLITGDVLGSYVYMDTIPNIFNDLAIDDRGNIYATSSYQQAVYKIDQLTDLMSIFFESTDISYPNGICISPDNKYLYIASGNNGIRIMDIESRQIIDQPDSTIISTGLDGIKFYKNSIIGLQNGVTESSEMKILQYLLDNTGTSLTDSKIIDQKNPHFDIPTTFVIADDELYCLANSQMGNIDFSTNEIRNYEALDEILILKYTLK